ncbi:MAG: MgtC/SapB family protein [Lachnospiraceae bacterium]|nr:MgtC/SapB family protein [Lachnospiraceae bacterium]
MRSMLQVLRDYLGELNMLSTFVRLALAMLCGGVLGMERGKKNRPAGFRTYMLVCVGATLVMLTNQYICMEYGTSDPARLGAQVISGIGFLGAGTIIVTGRNRVKGLTTAAGLWACACVGLAIGIGFYSGAIIGCALILLVMSVLHRMDDRMTANARILDMYLEFRKMSDLGVFMSKIKEFGMKISEIEMTKSSGTEDVGVAVLLTLKLEKKRLHTEVIEVLSQIEGVTYIEEL